MTTVAATGELTRPVIGILGDASRLIRAINALEAVLETSPSNFQVKLLLIRLWTNLGGWSRAWELFSTLGIKHTLKDTLRYVPVAIPRRIFVVDIGYRSSYILLDVADLIVSPDQVDKLLSAIQIIYVSNESETPQMLVKAYENGSYTKVLWRISRPFRDAYSRFLSPHLTDCRVSNVHEAAPNFNVASHP